MKYRSVLVLQTNTVDACYYDTVAIKETYRYIQITDIDRIHLTRSVFHPLPINRVDARY